MSVACRDESDVQFDGSDRGLAGSANITATLVQDDRRSTHRMTNRGRQHGHRAHWDRRPGGSACVIHSPCCPSAGSQPPRERANPRANAGRLQATPSQATLEAGQVPTERHRATPSDARNVTGVKGSPVQIRPSRQSFRSSEIPACAGPGTIRGPASHDFSHQPVYTRERASRPAARSSSLAANTGACSDSPMAESDGPLTSRRVARQCQTRCLPGRP